MNLLLLHLSQFKMINRKRGPKLNKCTGCPQKKLRLLWKAIAPLRIIVVIKVRGDSESTVAELFVQYHNFPVAQQGATAI